jgi:predicted AAA+ superfamily ATPase
MLGSDENGYIPRLVDAKMASLVAEGLSLFVTGPRACGKTTTAQRVCASEIRFDDDAQRIAFEASPDYVLGESRSPVLLDEWQLAPSSLGAVKRAVDRLGNTGTYVVTGSVRARVTSGSWPLTGRAIPIGMWGLTVAEIARRKLGSDWCDWAFGEEPPPSDSISDNLGDYIAYAVRGGFPAMASLRTIGRRQEWLAGYARLLAERDIPEVAEVRNPAALTRLLGAVAANTAGTPSSTALFQAAGLDSKTGSRYLDLLEDLRVIDRVQPWHTLRMKRLAKGRKLYLTDTGLACRLTAVDARSLLRDGHMLGRVMESFVLCQLRPLLDLNADRPIGRFHLRDANGDREVDILLRSADGRIVGIEVKAAASVSKRDARHLAWLRDTMGGDFARGIVLHTGTLAYPLGDKLWALPIATLWSWQ